MAGINSVNIDMEKQTVLVEGDISYEAALEKIKKTGRTVNGGETLKT